MAVKILFDDQIFEKKYGGIARYFYELIRHLNMDNNFSWELSVKCSENAYLLNSTFLQPDKIFNFEDFWLGLNFKGKFRIYKVLEKFGLIKNLSTNRMDSIRKVKRGKYDVFHPTYFNPYFLPHLKNKHFVLTIYDMIHELYHTQFPAGDTTSANKRLLAEKADVIIAISENTKNDIVKLYGIAPEKIKVIYLGTSLVASDEAVNIELPLKYILYIGNRSLYKNFKQFVRAIEPLFRHDPDLHLVCGGGNTFTADEKALFKELSCEDRIVYQNIDEDKTLTGLYKKARAFVFPSLYEGFGIPVLEAFACGCPNVLSNSSSLPEIASDAAEYFNPEDELSIAGAVRNVIYDENKRADLRNKGFERLKYFSWEKTASETKKVYESLI